MVFAKGISFLGACSVAMVCWYTRYTKEISKNVMFDDIIHFVDVRVGIVSSHFVLRKFVFSWNPVTLLEMQKYLEDLVGFSNHSLYPQDFLRGWGWTWADGGCDAFGIDERCCESEIFHWCLVANETWIGWTIVGVNVYSLVECEDYIWLYLYSILYIYVCLLL